MSKPRITAFSEHEWVERRMMCRLDPVNTPVGVVVEVEFLKGDHGAALAALEACVEDVKAQIAESHAPTWDVPRNEGEEPVGKIHVYTTPKPSGIEDAVARHQRSRLERA